MDLNEKSSKFLCDRINDYLKNFGKLNKNDFEVLIFHSLLIGSEDTLSNYYLSRELKIPESKVKKLRYEADLIYNRGEDYENKMFKEFIDILSKTKFKINNSDNFTYRIDLIIENPALRKFIEGKLKEGGIITDSSFNTEIIRIYAEDLGSIFEAFPEGKKIADNINDKVKEIIKQNNIKTPGNRPLTFTEVLPAILLNLTETVGNVTGLISGFTPSRLITGVSLPLIDRIINKKNK